jgi:hypothetical protein
MKRRSRVRRIITVFIFLCYVPTTKQKKEKGKEKGEKKKIANDECN